MLNHCEYSEINFDVFAQITDKYFGIHLEIIPYTRNIGLFMDGDCMGELNKFSKSELKLYVKSLLSGYSKDFTDAFITSEPIISSNIYDTFGKKIFENIEHKEGWLVFVDPINIANWSHPCEYWFIINENNVYSSKKEEWRPHKEIVLEKVMF